MQRVRLKNSLRRFAIYHYFIEVKLHEGRTQQIRKMFQMVLANGTVCSKAATTWTVVNSCFS